MKPFAIRRVIDDDQLTEVQRSTSETFASLATIPFLTGVLKTVDLIAGQDNIVSHGLGRAPLGHFMSLPSVSAKLGGDQTNNKLPTAFFYVQTDTNCSLTIWFF